MALSDNYNVITDKTLVIYDLTAENVSAMSIRLNWINLHCSHFMFVNVYRAAVPTHATHL